MIKKPPIPPTMPAISAAPLVAGAENSAGPATVVTPTRPSLLKLGAVLARAEIAFGSGCVGVDAAARHASQDAFRESGGH